MVHRRVAVEVSFLMVSFLLKEKGTTNDVPRIEVFNSTVYLDQKYDIFDQYHKLKSKHNEFALLSHS